ncbi:hypothetical protein PVAP13_4KG181200 [Panicum virgatum]|uniref:Uncharacterized protein n=2 Tax=Panicum virgatum TaxID=38727 RepID=A0A8T0TM78_PANVG|nr:hypothetical protein PVAP13_4KG181200 [Panicum virgatum]
MMSCRIPTPLRPGAHSKALLADLLRAVAAAADGKKGLGRLSIATASSAELRCFHSSHGNGSSANGKPASRFRRRDRLLPATMVNAASAAGFVALCAGLIALEIFCFLDPWPGAGTAPSAQAPLLDSALGLLVPLGAAAALLAAVASIYRRLSHAAAPAPAAGRRLSGVAIFILCVSAGALHFSLSAQPPGGGAGAADHVAQARALGLGALRVLPAAATATFFWGVMLIVVAHVRAGGEGGGGAAGAGAVQGPVRLLTNVALGAAAGLVLLVTIALGVKY